MNARTGALVSALAAPPEKTRTLVVGFSGGLDSTVLLHVLAHHAPPFALRALHVCHHLQPQAEAWAEHCRRQCLDWGIEFERLDVSVDGAGRGIEAAAREARYNAIETALTAGETFVTAHHCQDQAETFLLQALRGAGPRGLAGMPVLGTLGRYYHWRPWLGIERGAIRDYANGQGLDWIEDPTNRSPNLARSFLRTRVMPAVEAHWPAAGATLSRAAAHAQEAAEAIEALARIDLANVRDGEGALSCAALAGLTSARAKQVIRLWLAETGLDTPDHRHLEQILALPTSQLASSPCVHFADTDVRLFDGQLYCVPALVPSPTGQTLTWDGGELSLPARCGTLDIENAAAQALSLTVTFRAGGERLRQAGLGHRRLKDVLREAAIAPWVRERMPLIYFGDALVVVPGVWRHPEIERIAGAEFGTVIWRHRLLDGSLRVVRA